MLEYFYTCPVCADYVSLLIDPSQNRQSFIEDCERCCRPLEFTVQVDAQNVTYFDCRALEQ